MKDNLTSMCIFLSGKPYNFEQISREMRTAIPQLTGIAVSGSCFTVEGDFTGMSTEGVMLQLSYLVENHEPISTRIADERLRAHCLIKRHHRDIVRDLKAGSTSLTNETIRSLAGLPLAARASLFPLQLTGDDCVVYTCETEVAFSAYAVSIYEQTSTAIQTKVTALCAVNSATTKESINKLINTYTEV